MRQVTTSLLIAATLALSGCSYAFMKTPAPDYSPKKAEKRPVCTKSLGPAIADGALIALGLTLVGTTLDTSTSKGPVLGFGMIGGGIAGSIYGVNKSKQCRTATQNFHDNRRTQTADTDEASTQVEDSTSQDSTDLDETSTNASEKPLPTPAPSPYSIASINASPSHSPSWTSWS
jgi:hypothetical protein